jgi:hypothetical protein
MRDSKSLGIKFGISHFGLLLLFEHLINEIQKNNSISPTDDELKRSKQGHLTNDFARQINKIIKVQEPLLPLIFEKWPQIRKLVSYGDYELVAILVAPYVFTLEELSDKKERDVALLDMQYKMEDFFYNQLKVLYNSGFQYLYDIAVKNGCVKYLFDYNDYFPSNFLTQLYYSRRIGRDIEDIIKHDNFDESQYDFINKTSKEYEWLKRLLSIKDPKLQAYRNSYLESSLSRDEFIEFARRYEKPLRKISELYKMTDLSPDSFLLDMEHVKPDEIELRALANIISFHFYALLKSGVTEDDWRNFFSKNDNKDIMKWWYSDWIEAIIKFEQLKIERIKKEKNQINDKNTD